MESETRGYEVKCCNEGVSQGMDETRSWRGPGESTYREEGRVRHIAVNSSVTHDDCDEEVEMSGPKD